MAAIPLGTFLRFLRQQVGPRPEDSDTALLERFVQQREEDAFATLLGRYGPLVLRVCRQILAHEQDVEDAFQATFLVLAHKASSLHPGKPLAPWLHGVACRVAMEARRRKARRRYHEQQGAVMHADENLENGEGQDSGAVLHEEVDRLPAKYRQPLVLCYFDGQTHDQAAARLGWPVGTVRTRLSRGRDLLHRRLVRRGVTASATAFASILSQAVSTAAVPLVLSEATLRAVMLMAAGDAAAVSISTSVTSLVQGVLRTMFLSRLKPLVGVVLLVGILGMGLGLFWPTGPATSQAAAPVDPAQVKADLPGVVKGNTQFAFDLYGKVRQEQGNLFLSPYSVSTALAMTTGGAREQTLTQMEKTLRFPVEQNRLHAAFGSLLKDSRGGKGFQLNVANALWCQSGVPFRDKFMTLNETHYHAKPNGVDFAKATEQARQTINGWVEKQTQDKIKELLKPGVLKPTTRLVLTNAIYFKGEWALQFDKKQTREEPFLLAADNKANVPMMHQAGEFNYLREGSLQAVELPYAGKELSMVIFLPQPGGIAEFEKSLTAEKLGQWLGKLRPVQGLSVALPRFKMTKDYKLEEVLPVMGMSNAFDSKVADFGGISPVAKEQGWYITNVIHKAFVEVNEEGTEAAAATAVVIGDRGGPPPSFRADRPFFFVIRDQLSGSILFMGRVVDPRS